MKSNWSVLKEYINSKKINDIIYRNNFTNEITDRLTLSSFDRYCRSLLLLGLLDRNKPGQYIIKEYIPPKLNTVVMLHLLSDKQKWKNWFIPINDRINQYLNK